jgi:hypothetical protein
MQRRREGSSSPEARHDARRALAGRISGAPSGPELKGNKMSTLVLELRQGDLMVVNGAPIRFRNRTRIELAAKARFLFGKQIMAPDGANTPARRIYFALQTAYIGGDEEREPGLAAARGSSPSSWRPPPRPPCARCWRARWRRPRRMTATSR